MADRSLRGTGLGAKSYEDEQGVEFEPRSQIGFHCPKGHDFSVVFAEQAETPTEWTCPRCGTNALRADGQLPAAKDEKPVRTHWDMLRERRSVEDLERLLAERLSLLRSGQIGGSTTASDFTTPVATSSGRRKRSPRPEPSEAGSAA